MGPGGPRRIQEEPGSLEEPGRARGSQEEPGQGQPGEQYRIGGTLTSPSCDLVRIKLDISHTTYLSLKVGADEASTTLG